MRPTMGAAVTGIHLKRVERVHPELPAQIHGSIRRTGRGGAPQAPASALGQRGVGKGDTVALIAPNIPEALDVPWPSPCWVLLNANNVRLEPHLGHILSTARRRCCWWPPSSRPAASGPPSGRICW